MGGEAGIGRRRLYADRHGARGPARHPSRAIARRHKAALENWLAGEFERRGASSPAQLARGVAILIEECISLVLVHTLGA